MSENNQNERNIKKMEENKNSSERPLRNRWDKRLLYVFHKAIF